ncbi:MAG: polysaccharide biosynthesis tyrosine autokinase [bacterium]
MNNGKEGYSLNSNGVNQEPRFEDYLQIILRGKWWILSIFFLTMVTTVLYTYTRQPIYEATTSVLVDTKGQRSSGGFLFDISGFGDQKNIKNELEILKSRSIAEVVAKALLEKKFTDSTKLQKLPIIAPPENAAFEREFATVTEVISRLETTITFEPVRDSDVIKITAKGASAECAAIIANTYAAAYYDRNMFQSRARSRTVRVFLQEQLKSRQGNLDNAEQNLQKYMETEGIVSLDDEAKKVIDQLAQLEANRDAIDIEVQATENTLSSYQEELKKVEPNVARAMGEANDPYIRQMQNELAKVEVERDVFIAKNPSLTGQQIYTQTLNELNEKINGIREKLTKRTNEYLKSLIPGQTVTGANDPAAYLSLLKAKITEINIDRQSKLAKKRALIEVIKQYESQFERIPQRSIEYARLQRSRLSNEKLYLLVEEKYNEATINEQSEFGYIDIIDPAVVPGGPVSPRKQINLMVGALLGLVLGVGFVYIKEFMDVRVRTPEDLKKRGISPLSAIALMDEELKRLGGKTKINYEDQELDAHLLTFSNPLSSIAESFRRLRTNIQYARLDEPVRVILVTSANPSEGKSTTISNLAIAFAQTGKKVLLLDTDLRKPNLHNEFGLKREPGISDHLFGSAKEQDVIQPSIVENLDLICCGSIPPNPAEVLGSQKFRDFIEQMKKKYDFIFFDSPPVLAVSDPSILATIADGVIPVVSAGITRMDAVDRMMELLLGVGGKVLGVVLNNFDLRTAYGGYYGYYRYRYYSYGYGSKYGVYGDNGEGEKEIKRRKRETG